MTHSDLPLFAWQPPRKLIVFPMVKRIGRIRDVAGKMLDKPTERAADHYERQVTQSLQVQFEKIGLDDSEIDEQIGAFWVAVGHEMQRQLNGWSTGPGGAA